MLDLPLQETQRIAPIYTESENLQTSVVKSVTEESQVIQENWQIILEVTIARFSRERMSRASE